MFTINYENHKKRIPLDNYIHTAKKEFQEAANAVLTQGLSCWTCSWDIVEGMSPPPMSCISDVFPYVEVVLALPCETQCLVGFSMVLPRCKVRTLLTLLRRIEML